MGYPIRQKETIWRRPEWVSMCVVHLVVKWRKSNELYPAQSPPPSFSFFAPCNYCFIFFFPYLFIYLFFKSEFVFLVRVPLPVKTWNKKNSERERGGFSLLVLVMHHKLVERGKEKKKSVCLMYRLLRYYFFDLLVRSLLIMLFQSFFSVWGVNNLRSSLRQ